MSDTPSDPSRGRPVRPAIPPFRGPAGGARPAGVPAAGSPPAKAPPRPAVSPQVTPGAAARSTPARPFVGRTPIATSAVRPAQAAPTPPALPAIDPRAELPALDSSAPTPVATPAIEAPPASSGAWLSPDSAIRGEFGELVDEIPTGPSPEAPVFPTPPAPWPAVEDGGSWPDGLDAAADETPVAPPPAIEADATPLPSVDEFGFDPDATPPAGHAWDLGAAAETPAAIEYPEATDAPTAWDAGWDAGYGAQADAIHGALDAGDAGAQAGDPASYLAAEWPEPEAVAGPSGESAAPTPVVVPAIAEPSDVGVAPPDPLLVDASREDSAPAWGWDAAPREVETAPAPLEPDQAWEYAPAAPDSLKPQPTASSLAAAEALERVAAQLREGTLRADGFSPALGEAAALSAALAALLGVDARWDVR